ncbi:TetR/AcrR family transcriptional regulator [Streptomyces reniochalinae]|uniref:TetR/AcrR family transcriptional regulator n=1 Tax=Streptomyces reniochalinae TaxID=2250578 RepID=A0A367F0E2_9ACTN|nr:TetR family transcriptional regulator [Streptomyces reniochalinae]RCG23838.1 TetR/AcrR family transcriptional regulator [Streptomyces reniochalinae]
MASTAPNAGAASGPSAPPDAVTAPKEGRRERKKRETRTRISDIATGLFMARGFDAVTVAEIAEAADVSVNTVYNYFPAKEDLFFDREEEMVERTSALVRDRAPGQSAAAAVLGRLREDIGERNLYAGIKEGFGDFMRVVRESPALVARLMMLHHRTADRLRQTLADETGAGPGDPMPELVAYELVNLVDLVTRRATLSVADGVSPEQTARDALARLDAYESLVTGALLNYATKPAR